MDETNKMQDENIDVFENNENKKDLKTLGKEIFDKYKLVFYALPIVLIVGIVALYANSDQSNQVAVQNDNIDVSLPSSETKEMTNSKLEVMSDFDRLNAEQAKEENRSDKFNLESMSDQSPKTTNYQNENDKEVVNKVNQMLVEMEREKSVKQSVVYKEPTYSSYSTQKKEVDNSKYEKTQDNFDAFFNQKSSATSQMNSTAPSKLQTDPLIYASVKGDHIGIKNNSRVVLILPKETTINGRIYKKNTLIYAQTSFTGSRVNLNINNINQVPLNVKAYDAQDGNLGLQVEKSLMAETGSEVVSDGADEIDVTGVPLGNTLKSLFKRKQQEPKIDLLNNQRLILKISQ